MASEANPPDSPPGAGGDRLSPGKRKRLQQCYEHANRQMGQENYNFDYVSDLFTQCVAGDPSNFLYVQSFLANLKKKYNNNKKGSNLAFIKGAASRAMVKKGMLQKDWDGAIKAGLEVLKLNPWDVQTLTQMATASEEAGYNECQMAYLKTALEANPKDPDVCRVCAIALDKHKQFDQSIALWHRVEEMRPGDEEAGRAIARLAVEKTIRQGSWDDKDPSKTKFAKEGQAQLQGANVELSAIEKLEKAVSRKPNELANYLELAELYVRDEQFGKAESLLGRAFEVSKQDPNVRERWEEAQLRHLRQRISEAEKEVEENESDQAMAKLKELKKELNRKELEVFKYRCERYPTNLAFKYDLGVRYQLNALYNEAIKEFQHAKNDPRRKGLCLLNLGKCFQQIHQPRLALSQYEGAIEDIPDRDDANKKQALYLAGKLALGLKQLETAERHLSRLAEIDFGYKDVSALLDKIAKAREDGEHSGDKGEP